MYYLDLQKKNYIDWKRSVGCHIPFVYDGVCGEIIVVDYIDRIKATHRNPHILITIENYVPHPLEISTSTLRRGLLHNLVGNKIINVDKDMARYLVNPSDAYTVTYGSRKPIPMKCPHCGTIHDKKPNVVHTYGFSCAVCGDGYSIPNKIMRNILTQINVDFIPEVRKQHFLWMDKYIYDFYIYINNKHILIEMDGGYHKWQQDTDKIKNNLEEQNNFKLIRIDCDYNGDPTTYIKRSILKSDLSNVLDLSNVDWKQCKQVASDSDTRMACKLWEEKEYGTSEIAQELNKDRHTIISYLRRGKDVGICPSFNNQESIFRGHNVYLMLLKNNLPVGVFRHVHQLCNKSVEMFGVEFHAPSVRACYDKKETYKGFNIKRITKEEYEQYKMINNEVVKGDDTK